MKKKVLLCTGMVAMSMLFPIVYTTPINTTPTTVTAQVTDNTKTNFDFTTKSLKYGKVTGKYVQISNLSDAEEQKKINNILKTDAQAILKTISRINPKINLDIDVSGKYIKETDLFVVTYSGTYSYKKSAHPTNFCYESVIDVSKASRVNYSGKEIITKLENALQKGKFKVDAENSLVGAALEEYIKSLDTKDLADILKNLNFDTKKNSVNIPQVFMYETKDTIELVIPTIHVLGDYIKLSIKTGDLK